MRVYVNPLLMVWENNEHRFVLVEEINKQVNDLGLSVETGFDHVPVENGVPGELRYRYFVNFYSETDAVIFSTLVR